MYEETVKKVYWLGHGAFRIEAAQTIYIDPFELPSGSPKADVILITHEHYDHFSPEDVAAISTPDTSYVTISSVAKELKGDVHTVKAGDCVTVKGVEIEVVPAYKRQQEFHPKSAGHVGFVLNIDGTKVYHAGDTDLIPEMSSIKADIALLPVSGTYVMTAEEAIAAAKQIRPRLAIPMHYGAIVGDKSDAERFAAGCQVETKILEPAR